MENASKALIIAGAILLAILIIALAVFIFNKAKSATNMDNLNNQQIEAHNSTFQNYEGKINGTQAKSLIDAVRNNNSAADTNAQITVKYGSTSASSATDLGTIKNELLTTKTYTVKITGYQTAEGPYKGYVTQMSIE